MKNRKLTLEQQKQIALANIENETLFATESFKTVNEKLDRLNKQLLAGDASVAGELDELNAVAQKLKAEMGELKKRSANLKLRKSA